MKKKLMIKKLVTMGILVTMMSSIQSLTFAREEIVKVDELVQPAIKIQHPNQVTQPIVKVTYNLDKTSAVVILENTMPDVLSYYLNGEEKILYTEPITVTDYSLLTAIATKDGMEDSFPVIMPIEVNQDQVGQSSFRVFYSWDCTMAQIILGNSTPGATIYCAFDGGESIEYTGPIDVFESTALTITAKKAGMIDSEPEIHHIFLVK